MAAVRVKGAQRKRASNENKRIDFSEMSRLCFLSLAGVRCFAVLRLVKHDSLFSLDTKPIIWTFVDRRHNNSFTKDRNRHSEGCGKKGCGGSMERVQCVNSFNIVISILSIIFNNMKSLFMTISKGKKQQHKHQQTGGGWC